jgi:hypothetical protein
MNAMKGLLLGTAAGLVAMSSAQAADLPVKAKPVEYVKVCSLYGAGFFYVPGTNTCLKIGMYLRSDHAYGSTAAAYTLGGAAGGYDRVNTTLYGYRARMNLTTDWRTQSDYGVIRAYAAIIAQQSSGDATGATGVAGILRAFIQFAGFTVGHAVSYFDFFNGANYGYMPSTWGASTGVLGTDLVAYTWQLGNGVSASIDIEDGSVARRKQVVNASGGASFSSIGATTSDVQAPWSPDIAGNIRIDQAWGSAQLSGALHNMSGGYYAGLGAPNGTAIVSANGHPGDEWGYAIQGGFRLLNFLMPKDTFETSAYYCNGATTYCVSSNANAIYGSGNSLGYGVAPDGVFTTGGSIEKIESWGFQAAYEHFWNAQWRTAVVGGYTEVNYGGTATAMVCGTAPNSVNQFGFALASGTCNPDFSQTSISTRTAWNPHPSLEIGLDLIWTHLDTAFAGATTTAAFAPANGRAQGPYTFENQDRFIGLLRFQKNVLP